MHSNDYSVVRAGLFEDLPVINVDRPRFKTLVLQSAGDNVEKQDSSDFVFIFGSAITIY